MAYLSTPPSTYLRDVDVHKYIDCLRPTLVLLRSKYQSRIFKIQCLLGKVVEFLYTARLTGVFV